MKTLAENLYVVEHEAVGSFYKGAQVSGKDFASIKDQANADFKLDEHLSRLLNSGAISPATEIFQRPLTTADLLSAPAVPTEDVKP
jgi:hypothetical protein